MHRAAILLLGLLPALVWAVEGPVHAAFYEFGLLYHQGDGIDREVLDELARRTGSATETEVMARARIWSELEAGTLDLTVSGIRTPERERFAWFLPYLRLKNMAILNTGLAARIAGPADFLADPALIFGRVRSFRHGAAIDRFLAALPAERMLEVPTQEQLFQMLKAGRIHGMVAQPATYHYYLPLHAMERLVAVRDWAPDEAPVEHCLVLSRARFPDQAAVRPWREALAAMRADGTLRAILAHHLPAGEIDRLGMLPVD